MRNSDDDINVPSMVPDRDDVTSRSGRRGVSSSGRMGSRADPVIVRGPAKTSGGVRLMLTILFLGLIATGGAGYYFFTESQALKTELEDSNGRLLSLENRLSAVGENSEETTLNLVERIDSNFAEIDKLWAARNQMRQEIGANTTALATEKETVAAIGNAIQAQAERLNTASTQLTNIQTRIETITGNISNLDRFSQQLTTLSQEVTQVKSNLASMQGLSSRVGVSEQDIESINVFRLQLNQTISNMQTQINELQKRVSQP